MNDANKDIVLRNDTEIINDTAFNPDQVIKNAASIATSLANIINQKKLFTIIQGNKYVHATGWGIMMAMNRVSPCVIKSIRLDREDEIAYESEVELLSHENRIIGRASAICSSKEPSKRGQPEYVIKSMAQTRATSKAARLSFAWIMQLAGYEATPANEMEDVIMTNKMSDYNFLIKEFRSNVETIRKKNHPPKGNVMPLDSKDAPITPAPLAGKINNCSAFINTKSILAKINACKCIEDLEDAYKESCDLGLDIESREKIINACALRKKEILEEEKEPMDDVPQ